MLQSASLTDFEKVLPLVAQFHEEGHLPFDAIVTAEALRVFLRDEGEGKILLIEEGGALVGYVALSNYHSLEFGGRCYFLDELYIQPGFRRKGGATRALEDIIELAKTEGRHALFLEVDLAQETAVRLYARHGFANRPYVIQSLRLTQQERETDPQTSPG